MKKISISPLIKFFTIFGLVMGISACGGANNQNLADAFGEGADSATSGIVCWILGCK